MADPDAGYAALEAEALAFAADMDEHQGFPPRTSLRGGEDYWLRIALKARELHKGEQ